MARLTLKAISGLRAPTATAPPRGWSRSGPKSGSRSGFGADLRLQALVLAAAHVRQAAALRAQGRLTVQVDRDARRACAICSPKRRARSTHSSMRVRAQRHERDDVHGADARVGAGVLLHVDQLDGAADRRGGGAHDRLGGAGEGHHAAVVGLVARVVEQRDAVDLADGAARSPRRTSAGGPRRSSARTRSGWPRSDLSLPASPASVRRRRPQPDAGSSRPMVSGFVPRARASRSASSCSGMAEPSAAASMRGSRAGQRHGHAPGRGQVRGKVVAQVGRHDRRGRHAQRGCRAQDRRRPLETATSPRASPSVRISTRPVRSSAAARWPWRNGLELERRRRADGALLRP